MDNNNENIEVINNEKNHRFELKINEEYGFVPYNIQGDLIALFHTEIPEALRGQGLGKILALYALNYAKDHRLKILPYCPFIAKYIHEHPEWEQYVSPFPR